jgi:pyridinium-3,5-biscarboxylic acid mononucleotide sulfurtransferase
VAENPITPASCSAGALAPVARLRRIIRDLGSVVIAYSGGVDSAVVAAVASEELGARALAVTGRSPSLAQGEIEAAIAVARRIGIAHEIIDTREFDNPEYRANPADRCFYCKDELFARLRALQQTRGYASVADGFNADDGTAPLDVRPGRRAALDRGVRSPLAEAGLGKEGVRALARALELRIWAKPATPCLSSRVPYGTRIELDDLRRIDLAERYLRARGFDVVRVRHHGATARIEVAASQVERLQRDRIRLAEVLREVGYQHVEIDERGYRTGSLNESVSS